MTTLKEIGSAYGAAPIDEGPFEGIATLVAVDPARKYDAVKLIREYLPDMSLSEVVAELEVLPKVLGPVLTRAEAEEFRRWCAQAGLTVEIR